MMMLCRRHAETTCFSSKFQNPSHDTIGHHKFSGLTFCRLTDGATFWLKRLQSPVDSEPRWSTGSVCTSIIRNKVNAFSSVALGNSAAVATTTFFSITTKSYQPSVIIILSSSIVLKRLINSWTRQQKNIIRHISNILERRKEKKEYKKCSSIRIEHQ